MRGSLRRRNRRQHDHGPERWELRAYLGRDEKGRERHALRAFTGRGVRPRAPSQLSLAKPTGHGESQHHARRSANMRPNGSRHGTPPASSPPKRSSVIAAFPEFVDEQQVVLISLIARRRSRCSGRSPRPAYNP
jgi:hypothetical protein